MVCFSFFFQAEDGIRDLTVTGVQTCALPIWASHLHGLGALPVRVFLLLLSTEGGVGATAGDAPGPVPKGEGVRGEQRPEWWRSEERRVGKECRARGAPEY